MLSHSGLFTLALLGAVIFAVLRYGADPDLDALAVPSSSECALVGDNGASVHVARDGAEGHASMKLEIHDAQAQVVGILHVFADGELALEPAGSDPVRFIFYRMPGGELGLGEPDGRAEIARGAGHDGSVYVDVLFKDVDTQRFQGVRVKADGEILKNPNPDHSDIGVPHSSEQTRTVSPPTAL